MRIPSTSNNLIRSTFCPHLMFSHDNKVNRWKDVEVLNRFPFFRGHTVNSESQTLQSSSSWKRGRQCFFLFFTISVTRYFAIPFTKWRCMWQILSGRSGRCREHTHVRGQRSGCKQMSTISGRHLEEPSTSTYVRHLQVFSTDIDIFWSQSLIFATFLVKMLEK